jgi:cell wall-associated NlpC family hydrolase
MTRSQFYTVILLFALPAFLPGCGTFSEYQKPGQIYWDSTHSHVNLRNSQLVKKTLYKQYRTWKGTPYRYGGLTKSGIDCSGFVYMTFKRQFGVQLPRSTKEMIEVGQNVTGNRLKPGDLLFFTTGFFDHHVGIYLGSSKFLHASESHGVMISSLNNQYWTSNFEEARRIR